MSRGIWLYMGARTRRSLALLWTALFILSLALQYASFAAPQNALAVHDDGLFELDGNAVASAAPGDDWNSHGNADAFVFVEDGVPERSFTGGGSKDILDTDQWAHTLTNVPDKDDLLHAYAALYGDVLYFGTDRYANNGDAAVGFWFFKNGINVNPDGTFTPVHAVGDLFVVSHFVNGGSNAEIELYEWNGSTISLIATGQNCTGAPAADMACAITNDAPETAPWPYTPKSGPSGTFPANSFFEGGLDLSEVYDGPAPCFTGFLVETRSSQETTAQLKDFVSGNFNTCEPPNIATQVSASTINVGESVTDTADLTKNSPMPTGKIDFYVCGPNASATACTSGGTKVGATKTLSGGLATSDAFTVNDPTKTGFYCFRAVYTPDQAGSNHYVAGSHTNTTTECFKVLKAGIDITKTADAASVSAGDPIGFTLTVASIDEGTAKGVTVTDTLPTNAGLAWVESPDNAQCSIAGGVLTCNFGDMPNGTSKTVHITSPTTPASCGAVNNTGNVTTTNDGIDSASASVTVNCPDVRVTKTPDGGSVQAGDNAVFTILVENIGTGIARNVTLTDTLPAGYTWTPVASAGSCSITSGVLNCSFGDLAPGAPGSRTVTLTAATTFASCALIPNAASAAATNEAASATGNNSDTGSIDVLCASIDIEKTANTGNPANPTGPVNAGDTIGFDIVVTNNGDGEARNVVVVDTVPTTAGTSWSISPAVTGCSIAAGVLTCNLGTMAARASVTIHLTSSTTPASCAVVNNTASVTTLNDGSDSDSASLTVLCPDVTVTKTADPVGPVNAGDQIGFVVTISNLGQGTAYDATASDTLPAGISWTISGPANGWSLNGGTLSFGPTNLIGGASASVKVVGTTDPADCSTITNNVTVSATNEANTSNNSASASVVVNCPDVTVEKTADVTPIDAGDAASFTIEVWNAGPGTAYGVTLTDTLPAGTWIVDNIDPNGVTGPVTCDPIVGGILSCDLGTMEPGRGANSVFITIARQTSVAECAPDDYQLLNSVVVAATNEAASAPLPNSDSATIDVRCPDLGISKESDHEGPVSAGDQVGFTVTIINTGTGGATGVSVNDPLPAGLDWSLVAADTDPGWTLTGPVGTEVLRFAGTLASGQTSSAHVTATSDPADCGSVPNLASLFLGEGFIDDDNAAEIVQCPNITVAKTAVPAGPVSAGDTIGFDVTISNAGPGTAYGAQASDTLPGSGWAIVGPANGWSLVGSSLTYGPATLAAGAGATVRVERATAPADCGLVPNTVTGFATNEPASSQPNTASDDVTVLCAAIDISKTADAGSVVAGSQIGFTVTVKNNGAGTAFGVQASDTLPTQAGLSWSIATPVAGWSIAGGTLTYSATSLAPGASSSVHIVSPTTRASCAVIDNTASVTTANDGSDTASASVTVVCPTLTLEKTNDAPLVEIDPELPLLPTLEEGETATFTLTYTLTQGPVTNGVLTDVLPNGLEYVAGTASSNDEFTFVGYDAPTRTLTWTAPTVTKNGSLSYDATAADGAADLAQPLVNTATIDSAQTEPDSDTSDVFVPAEPEPVTSSPTPPPTDTFDTPQAGSPGFTLMLVLLALAGFALAIGFVTPVPERVRRRDRRG